MQSTASQNDIELLDQIAYDLLSIQFLNYTGNFGIHA